MHGSHRHQHVHTHETPQAQIDPSDGSVGVGHNAASQATQWQTPHQPRDHQHVHQDPRPDHAKDMDLVEAAFCEAFASASDPTSFVRLAGIPFEAVTEDGKRLVLLRVEHQSTTDIGNVTPHLGGQSFRYAPLPAKLASSRSELRFSYFDGRSVQRLSLEQAKAMAPAVE